MNYEHEQSIFEMFCNSQRWPSRINPLATVLFKPNPSLTQFFQFCVSSLRSQITGNIGSVIAPPFHQIQHKNMPALMDLVLVGHKCSASCKTLGVYIVQLPGVPDRYHPSLPLHCCCKALLSFSFPSNATNAVHS